MLELTNRPPPAPPALNAEGTTKHERVIPARSTLTRTLEEGGRMLIAGTEKREDIELVVGPGEGGVGTMIAIRTTAPDTNRYTHALVRLFFIPMRPVVPHPVVVSLFDIVPLMGDAHSGAYFPVGLNEGQFIRVELMRFHSVADFFRPAT